MKEFLDKTGLDYFYNKLCSVFYMKGLPIKTNISADQIASALGYSPVSLNQLNSSVADVKAELNTYSLNFENLKDSVTTIGSKVDLANNTLALYGSYIDENKTKLSSVLTVLDAQSATIDNIAKHYDSTTEELTSAQLRLDAQNATINSLLTRTNGQTAQIASIQQSLSDNEASIESCVSIDDVKSYIALKVVDSNGNLNSNITLSADLIVNDGETLFVDSALRNELYGGTTLIGGGYIKTSLINTDALLVKHLNGADGDFTGTVTATTLKLGTDADAKAYDNWDSLKSDLHVTDDLVESVIETKFKDLYVKTEDLATKVEASGALDDLVSTDDLSGYSKVTESNGLITIDTNGTKSYAYSKTTADGKYMIYGTGKGTNESGNAYFAVDTTGLMVARNAIIYGTIYATAGEFSGKITSTEGTIGGWNIDNTSLYHADTTGGMSLDSDEKRIELRDLKNKCYITITPEYLRSTDYSTGKINTGWSLGSTGVGSLANGNFRWDKEGKVFLTNLWLLDDSEYGVNLDNKTLLISKGDSCSSITYNNIEISNGLDGEKSNYITVTTEGISFDNNSFKSINANKLAINTSDLYLHGNTYVADEDDSFNVCIKDDGSGYVAKENISWTEYGNTTINGSVEIKDYLSITGDTDAYNPITIHGDNNNVVITTTGFNIEPKTGTGFTITFEELYYLLHPEKEEAETEEEVEEETEPEVEDIPSVDTTE